MNRSNSLPIDSDVPTAQIRDLLVSELHQDIWIDWTDLDQRNLEKINEKRINSKNRV